MAKRPRAPSDYDSPWKDALQAYLPAFLAFFFPDIYADIDWMRGYESLDKEFQQIIRKAKIGKRYADKLFKVWLKDGAERWLLIHVEIQADFEKEFPQRMFNYHIAIRQMYNRGMASLAVLCDDNAQWRPTRFEYEQWGCSVAFEYRVAKLLDQRGNLDALEASDNPFATVVLAHLHTMQTRDDPLTRKQWKLRVAKGLLQRKWSKDDIRELLRLIDWIMALPDELDEQFQNELHSFEKERNMEYVTTFERYGIKKGVKNGILECIAEDVREKFSAAGRKLLPQIQALNADDLRKFRKFLKRAETLDEVREYLK